MTSPAASAHPSRIGFLGPSGTFTEQALLTQQDLASADLVPLGSISDVLHAAHTGEVDLGFVAIENAIEGSVNVTLDTLALDTDLLIQREVVMAVHLCLMARPGVKLDRLSNVVSIPVATAQCRAFLRAELPAVKLLAANSTAEAAKQLAHDGDDQTGVIAPLRSAQVYGLDVLATEIEDHPENKTRFVMVAEGGIPKSTGHDKTSIVVFQRADEPGSLLAILQEFAARNINLTKLSSRPTKVNLGDYCFLIDMEGHLSDELVADALRTLKSKQSDVKFLGSYPAAGEHGTAVRRDMHEAWRRADEWIADLRSHIET